MKEKLRFSAGILNCVSGAAMAVHTLFMLLVVIVFVVMPILLPIWFLPMAVFIPVVGMAFVVSFAAAVCNFISGVGTVVASMNGGKVSNVLTVISTAVDAIFTPVSLMFLILWSVVNSKPSAVSGFSVSLLAVTALMFAVSVAGLIVNLICLRRFDKKY